MATFIQKTLQVSGKSRSSTVATGADSPMTAIASLAANPTIMLFASALQAAFVTRTSGGFAPSRIVESRAIP